MSGRSGLLVAWEGEEDRGGFGGAAAPRVLLAVGVRPVREVPRQSGQVLRLPRQPQMVLVIVLQNQSSDWDNTYRWSVFTFLFGFLKSITSMFALA